jgi:hypothetical protein
MLLAGCDSDSSDTEEATQQTKTMSDLMKDKRIERPAGPRRGQ